MGSDLGLAFVTPGDDQANELARWHQRYLQQAQWTADIRAYLLKKAGSEVNHNVLEVGSGTGALLTCLEQEGDYQLTGIDIDPLSLRFSQDQPIPALMAQADGYRLPFAEHTFGITLCHYLLLWIEHPRQILQEMRRVTHPGGSVIALAEPDHPSRIDFPPPLDELGGLQTQALRNQGAHVAVGRRLGQLFHQIGLQDIEVGILGALWSQTTWEQPDEVEWMALQHDLASHLRAERLAEFKAIDQRARHNRERILFIPTFYAIGTVP